ncbi:hypothetical protein AB9E19_02515 [Rhizobium leguminosarum]|uniref:hypothetical protein n=1 Tax=Rhizobium leguminosarum TaxID=384 RepID=UPI003F970AA8
MLIRTRLTAELNEISNKAIAKLAGLPPIPNDGNNIRPSAPPHTDAAVGFQPSAVSFEASAFDLQNSGRKTNRHSLDGRTNRCSAS